MPDPSKPWRLTQFIPGVKAWEFATREAAMKMFDSMRFNSRSPIQDAGLFGPGGEAWWCAGTRYAQWNRDDERRKRMPEPEEATA